MKKLAVCLITVLLSGVLAGPAVLAAPANPPVDPVLSPTEKDRPRPDLPDPNDPESPETITIVDGDVPLTFIKVWDPEMEEFVYILDEDVPLAGVDSPQTGDTLPSLTEVSLWGMAAAGSAVLLMRRKRG